MQRDHKIGLALGILLVGAVGALFFRHDAMLPSDVPQLQRPDLVDDQVAQKERAPYRVEERVTAPPVPEYQYQLEETTDVVDAPRVETHVPTPPDVADVAEVAEVVVIPPQAVTEDGDVREHVVRSGETLSSLATRYLGHESRHHELFQANRDRMKSPRDLKIGTKLRIPSANSVEKSVVVEQPPLRAIEQTAERETVLESPAAAAPTPDPVEADSKRPRKFVPVRRSPLNPRSATPIEERSPSDVGGRRLSQSPPEDSIVR